MPGNRNVNDKISSMSAERKGELSEHSGGATSQ